MLKTSRLAGSLDFHHDQFWTFFGKNGQNGIFSKKRLEYYFRAFNPQLTAKIQKKINEGITRKMQKTCIFGHFSPKRPILTVFWPKLAKRDFYKKSAWKIFPPLQTLTNCNVSEKSNEWISRYFQMDGQMDGGMNKRGLT